MPSPLAAILPVAKSYAWSSDSPLWWNCPSTLTRSPPQVPKSARLAEVRSPGRPEVTTAPKDAPKWSTSTSHSRSGSRSGLANGSSA